MRGWRATLLAILALGLAGPVAAQEAGPRVLVDAPIVVMPGGAGPQCLALDGGTLTAEVRRMHDLGGGSLPVRFAIRPFVVAAGLIDLTVPDVAVSTATTIALGIYCYDFQHADAWTNRPESAPKGQVVRLRLTWAPP